MDRPKDVTDEQWQAFSLFVDTGEASEDFLTALATTPALQAAADQAFAEKVQDFRTQSLTKLATTPAEVMLEIGAQFARMPAPAQEQELRRLQVQAKQSPEAAAAIARLAAATGG